MAMVVLLAAPCAWGDDDTCETDADCPTGAACGTVGGHAYVPCGCDESEPDCDCSDLPDGSPILGCKAATCVEDSDCGHPQLRCVERAGAISISKDEGKKQAPATFRCANSAGAECSDAEDCWGSFECSSGVCLVPITICETEADCLPQWSCYVPPVVEEVPEWTACLFTSPESAPACVNLDGKGVCAPYEAEIFGAGGVSVNPKEAVERMLQAYEDGATPSAAVPESETEETATDDKQAPKADTSRSTSGCTTTAEGAANSAVTLLLLLLVGLASRPTARFRRG